MKSTSGSDDPNFLITGLGIISAAGLNRDETITTLFSPEPFAAGQSPTLRVSEDALQEFENKKCGRELRVNQLAVIAIHEALEMAGLTPEKIRKLRVGICLGSTVGCYNFQDGFADEYNLKKFPDPKKLNSHFKNNSAQFLARHFELRGPVQLISNACTSGADSIGIAAGWLRADLCDLVICGGSEVILPQIYAGFKSLQLCAPTLCKPFDRERKGLTLGEGAGFIILEKSSTARAPIARYLGFMSASDAYHPTAPHPEARGLQRATKILLNDLEQPKIDFINAHGTATAHNDRAEGRLLKNYFSMVPVVATKAYTGHTLAAAGAIEAIFTILSLQLQKLPPSRGFTIVDPEIDLTPTQGVIAGNFSTALSFSLGFGGTNSVLALGRAT